MEFSDSFELYTALENLDLLKNSPPMWWPAYGTYEVAIGAMLTQNTQWSRVEVSLENLRAASLLSPESLASADPEILMELIRPSGLFKAKSANLIRLSSNLLEAFGDFDTFADAVERDWLLRQKGIGPETADSILCYALKRPVMVVDAYTARLLRSYGYEFESYDDLQEWCVSGLLSRFGEEELSVAFARFHGMIVEYVKENSKGKAVNVERISSTI